MTTPSIVAVPEHSLVELLFGDLRTFEHVAIPPQTPWPADFRLRVSPKCLGLDKDAFGDADALLVPNGTPELARAVEFKRVLMPSTSFATIQPNKLQELRKGVAQANRLSSAGFAVVWLSVLVVVDSRGMTTRTGGYLAASRPMMDAVYNALPLSDLDHSVGVTVYELTQCFDRPLEKSGMVSGNIVRMGLTKPQPQTLTDGIERYIASRPSQAAADGLHVAMPPFDKLPNQ